MSTRQTHPLEWVSLAFAIVALSYTEWSLAVAAGAHPWVAAAVPGALDVYAVRAMRVRRHVPVVVLAMVSVNALSYLVHAHVLAVTWPVLIVVSAIAPLTFWAVHALGHGEAVPDMAEARKRTVWDVPPDAELDPWSHVEITGQTDTWDTFDAHVASVPGVRDLEAGTPDLLPGIPCTCSHKVTQHNEHGCYVYLCPCLAVPSMRAPSCSASCTASDPTPAAGLVQKDFDGTEVIHEHTVHEESDTPGHTNVLTLQLPGGFEHIEPSAGDRDAASFWREWFEEHVMEHGKEPSLRKVKRGCCVSTDRARTMLKIWKENQNA